MDFLGFMKNYYEKLTNVGCPNFHATLAWIWPKTVPYCRTVTFNAFWTNLSAGKTNTMD